MPPQLLVPRPPLPSHSPPAAHPPPFLQAGTPIATLCDACVCALAGIFAPPLQAAGVVAEGVTAADAQNAITSCIPTVLGPMQRAGVSLNTLLSLGQCQALPACLSQYGIDVATEGGN